MMGATLEHAMALDAVVHMHTYARKPVMFVRGEGMRLFDDAGREYLDFVSGIGAVNLGHAHPAVAAAVCEQVGKLVHVSNLYYVEHRDELAEDLVALFGGDARVFFSNSGAEANEGLIKLARKWANLNKPGAYKVVTAWRSFHGRTLATLAATGQPAKQDSFRPLPEGFVHVPLNAVDALAAAVDESVAAVLLEPVQGEGGVWPCEAAYLEAARRICDEHDALLMFDEVQSGCYRTGPAFAYQAYDVRPDAIALAKSLANGLPIGAMVAVTDVADSFSPGDHGSTFGGGPVVCAAGRATLTALESEHLGSNAETVGAYLRDGLEALGLRTGALSQVRGAGLMVGVTLSQPIAAEVAAAALERGLVVNNIGTDILRFLPPLVCGTEQVDTLLAVLDDILRETSA